MIYYVFSELFTHSLVLMLHYHILTTKHYTVPLFIRYVLVCVCFILHTITCANVTISHINNQAFYRSSVYTVCSFMRSLYFTHNPSTKVTISYISNQTFYRSLLYTVCSSMCSLYFTHNHLY